jgi:hypothetical protein
MATSDMVPFADVRRLILLARREGGRLAGRITQDVPALVFRTPAELAADVRKLQRGVRTTAGAAVKDLEARGASVVGIVERQVSRALGVVLRPLVASMEDEIDALERRVALLEKRLTSGERPKRSSRSRRPNA